MVLLCVVVSEVVPVVVVDAVSFQLLVEFVVVSVVVSCSLCMCCIRLANCRSDMVVVARRMVVYCVSVDVQ